MWPLATFDHVTDRLSIPCVRFRNSISGPYSSILFNLQQSSPVGLDTSHRYWIYWNNPNAGAPPSSLAAVFGAGTADTFDADFANWQSNCTSRATTSWSSGQVNISTSNTSGSSCMFFKRSAPALTGQARRISVRFKTPNSRNNAIRVGMTWGRGLNDWANAVEIRA